MLSYGADIKEGIILMRRAYGRHVATHQGQKHEAMEPSDFLMLLMIHLCIMRSIKVWTSCCWSLEESY